MNRRKYNPIVHHVDNRIYKTIFNDSLILEIFEYEDPWRSAVIKYDVVIDDNFCFDCSPLGEIIADNHGKAEWVMQEYAKYYKKYIYNYPQRKKFFDEINKIINELQKRR